MKWTIAQLLKFRDKPFVIDEKIDFSEVAKFNTDIRSISKVHITGQGQQVGQKVVFDLNIQCVVTLSCAITLDNVKYPINIKTREIFSFDENDYEDEDIIIVKGKTVELAPIIWQNIVLEIPLRVISEGAYDKVDKKGSDWELTEENEQEEQLDPRFAVLKDLFKGK